MNGKLYSRLTFYLSSERAVSVLHMALMICEINTLCDIKNVRMHANALVVPCPGRSQDIIHDSIVGF